MINLHANFHTDNLVAMAENLTSVAHNNENSSGRSTPSRVIADLITDRRSAELQSEVLFSDTPAHASRRYRSNDHSGVGKEGHTTKTNVFADVGEEASKNRYNGGTPWRQLAIVEAAELLNRYIIIASCKP